MRHLQIWTILLCLGLVFSCKKSDDSSSEEAAKSANLLAIGKSANDILSNDTFTKLKIEIAYVTGFRPTRATTIVLENYLKTYTFKEDIEIVFNELPSPGKETLTLEEIADLETENRTVYNDGETLGVYIYFTDAPSSSDDEGATLGAVYRNTTMVIYQPTVRRIAVRNIIRESVVETATIKHEFGHLLGLVDLGSTPVNEHEDPESENHCNIAGCLMGAELQFSRVGKSSSYAEENDWLKSACSFNEKSLLKILKSSTSKSLKNTTSLDDECILDLKSNGGR
ncbi:hypothetical protein FEE95_01135 [Maribacter algarum]|uniref:Membrane metalloprotease n=1 Tax=Maribacter algarum (ex Zhang et al. 2020) TaxID=2578118 RepID=A0A5S3PT06_9FLAO|nr:hypothetical protein [Maribacter algarum]TMM58060.1 hypothetical protein FEE95_01135 [Maribacter algarum]